MWLGHRNCMQSEREERREGEERRGKGGGWGMEREGWRMGKEWRREEVREEKGWGRKG